MDQLTVDIAQRQFNTFELHGQAFCQVLNVDHNHLSIVVQSINLVHNDVEMVASTDGCINQNICHLDQLVLKFCINRTCFSGQQFHHISLEGLIFNDFVHIHDLSEIRSLPVITVSKDGLDVVEGINTEVVPTNVHGNHVGIGQCIPVSLTQDGHATGFSDLEPVLTTGKAPIHISVAFIGIVQQITQFFHTHGADGELSQFQIVIICDLIGVSFLGCTVITVNVKLRLIRC